MVRLTLLPLPPAILHRLVVPLVRRVEFGRCLDGSDGGFLLLVQRRVGSRCWLERGFAAPEGHGWWISVVSWVWV